MSKNRQTTLESIEIEEYNGNITCCEVTGYDGQIPLKCGNKSVIRLRKGVRAKHYCRIHARKTWLEMGDIDG